jgi:hypothetical protein
MRSIVRTRKVAALSVMTRFHLLISALSRRLSGTALLVLLDLVLHAQEEDLFAPFPRPYATIGDLIGTVRSDASRADDEAISKAAAELEDEKLLHRCDRLALYGRVGPGTPYFWTLIRPLAVPLAPVWRWWQEAVRLAAAFAPFLDRNATAAYLRLLPLVDADGAAVFSASSLDRAVGMHRDTSRRCMQKLEDAGLLHWYPSDNNPESIAIWLCIPAAVSIPDRDLSASERARQQAVQEAAAARQWQLSVPFDRVEGERLASQVWPPYEEIATTIRLLGRSRRNAYSNQEIVELVLRPLIQLQYRHGDGLGLVALRQARSAALSRLARGGRIDNYYSYVAAIIDAKLYQSGLRTETHPDDD